MLSIHYHKQVKKDPVNWLTALNVLHAEKEKMYPAYVSKHNSKCK